MKPHHHRESSSPPPRITPNSMLIMIKGGREGQPGHLPALAGEEISIPSPYVVDTSACSPSSPLHQAGVASMRGGPRLNALTPLIKGGESCERERVGTPPHPFPLPAGGDPQGLHPREIVAPFLYGLIQRGGWFRGERGLPLGPSLCHPLWAGLANGVSRPPRPCYCPVVGTVSMVVKGSAIKPPPSISRTGARSRPAEW